MGTHNDQIEVAPSDLQHLGRLVLKTAPLLPRQAKFRMTRSAQQSGGEIGHQLYDEFGTGKLNGVNFQRAPAHESQGSGYGFRRLDAARAALE